MGNYKRLNNVQKHFFFLKNFHIAEHTKKSLKCYSYIFRQNYCFWKELFLWKNRYKVAVKILKLGKKCKLDKNLLKFFLQNLLYKNFGENIIPPSTKYSHFFLLVEKSFKCVSHIKNQILKTTKSFCKSTLRKPESV